MAVQRRDPYRGFNFRVAIGGRARATEGFSSVRLPTMPTRPEFIADAGLALGDAHDAHLVLRRGFTGALDLYEWWTQERGPKPGRGRAVTVDLLDETVREVVAAWRFTGCRPIALHYSPLDALGSTIVTESIVLTFDDVEIV
jgi:phage tail-like protein